MPTADESTTSSPGPTSPAVAITVVTYDAPPHLLERCLQLLLRTTEAAAPAIVVADTGGAARRRVDDAGLTDRVDVVDLGGNHGFAAGLTAGFRRGLGAGAEVLVGLNDDVFVEAGWLEPLVDRLTRGDRLGAVQPLLLQLDAEPPEINSAGVIIDRHGAGSDAGRGRPPDAVHSGRIDAVTGGAAAWSASFVRDVGFPDPRFFLYYEDVEWCRRGTTRGWGFELVAESRVTHAGSASTHRLGPSLRRIQERNRLWSVAMSGDVREHASALGLSLRRLRHAPRTTHRQALLGGLGGMVPRLAQRAARRSPAPFPEVSVEPPTFLHRRVEGVNVFGYHHISSGLGDNARTIARCLRAAGVDVVEIDNDRSPSPRLRPARPVPGHVHDTTIAVVTAFEFEAIVARYPELRAPGRRLVGYWMWELTTIPDAHRAAMDVVDEIWTASRFVRDAYAAVAPGWIPVRRMPYQVPRPDADPARVAAWRARWGDRFVFLVTSDFLSVPERKNPVAAVRAFVEAFGPGDGASLVVKSINGDHRPEAMAALRSTAGDRPDVEILDEHLDEPDHHALIAAADCLVSPHRSEGFGLQPFAALSMGTPVISTRYGGVLDYLGDEHALLVDHELTGVVDGEGIYPVGAPWADIDHTELVGAMRRIAGDAALRQRLIATGRRVAASWPDDRTLGLGYLAMLERGTPRTTDIGDVIGVGRRWSLTRRRSQRCGAAGQEGPGAS